MPMTSDVARVIRADRQSRSLIFGLIGGLVGIATILFALWGGTGALIAFPVAVIAVTFIALAWFTWSRAGQDLTRGIIIRANGTIRLTDATTSSDVGFNRRVCKLVVGDTKLAIGNAAADLVRSRAAAAFKKSKSSILWNMLTDTSGEDLAFVGTVEYAPRSSLVLSIRTADGLPIWRHPGLAPDGSPTP